MPERSTRIVINTGPLLLLLSIVFPAAFVVEIQGAKFHFNLSQDLDVLHLLLDDAPRSLMKTTVWEPKVAIVRNEIEFFC